MRLSGHIPWSQVERSLAAARSIWVSSTRPDGRPHAVPVWFCWYESDIYFVTGRGTQKARNLAHQPYAIVHAADGDDAIILEGRVDTVTDPATRERINTLYGEKYVAPRTGERASIFGANDDVYRVRVQHVMVWEYGDMATRTDWWP